MGTFDGLDDVLNIAKPNIPEETEIVKEEPNTEPKLNRKWMTKLKTTNTLEVIFTL